MARAKIIASEYRSWLAVVLWTVILLLTVPLARTLQAYVRAALGDTSFGYIVIALVSLSAIYLIYRLKHAVWKLEPVRIVWIILCAVFLIAYTLKLWSNPVEALHFIQYGVLAGLLYNAFSWRHGGMFVYIAVIITTAIVGIVDETLQWLTPNRVWGLDDIAVNTMAGIVICIVIAKGIRPQQAAHSGNTKSVRLVLGLSIICLSLLILSFANTPDMIRWYGDRIVSLAFLSKNGHIMAEYGYRYDDESIGLFRSRFSYKELKEYDLKNAVDAAQKLDAAPLPEDYREFITRYSPMTDPFLHELRVHLNRRDYYLKTSKQTERYSQAEQKRRLRIAYFENKIVEEYFPNSLEKSSFPLDSVDKEFINSDETIKTYYESPVSKNLITLMTKKQLLSLLSVALAILMVLYFRISHREY